MSRPGAPITPAQRAVRTGAGARMPDVAVRKSDGSTPAIPRHGWCVRCHIVGFQPSQMNNTLIRNLPSLLVVVALAACSNSSGSSVDSRPIDGS